MTIATRAQSSPPRTMTWLAAFLALSLTACAQDVSRPSIRSGAGAPLEDVQPTATGALACATSDLTREEAIEIALSSAAREAFEGDDGEPAPTIEGAWFMSTDELWKRFEVDMWEPSSPCVWYVSMSGRGILTRYPPGSSPPTPPIIWRAMKVIIDDATGFASAMSQSMGPATSRLPPIVEDRPRPVLTLDPPELGYPGPPPTPGPPPGE